MRHILLDSAPLSALSLPSTVRTASSGIAEWTRSCVQAGHRIYVPEIIDYKLRRELLRARKTASVSELDHLRRAFSFLAITSDAMLRAAEIWAQSRNTGLPTGDPKKLDIDVILAAQALTLDASPTDIVVATHNVAHISRFVSADLWSNILP